jgi:NAD-dependent deacetylase sirtuin 4
MLKRLIQSVCSSHTQISKLQQCSSCIYNHSFTSSLCASPNVQSLPTSSTSVSFVAPASQAITNQQIGKLATFITSKKKLCVITGAGCSTESGVPDYRSPNGSYSKGHKPTNYQEFINNELARKRYWARSMHGWSFFSNSQPNPSHTCLSTLEQEGFVDYIITQNVDRLHHKAGSKRVIELHGHSSSVTCLNCSDEIPREYFQKKLAQLNHDWLHKHSFNSSTARPDGDVDLGNVDYSLFRLPNCEKCEVGVMKPTVVFFGENVPQKTVDFAMDLILQSDGLLCIGTSLQVYSAFRFVKAASEYNIPIGILNIGPTRADTLPCVFLKIEARSGEILPRVVTQIFSDTNYKK